MAPDPTVAQVATILHTSTIRTMVQIHGSFNSEFTTL